MRKIIILSLAILILFIVGCGGSRSKKDLENELAYRQLGINKLEEGDYEEAVKAFQKALDQSMAVIDELEIDICYYKAAAQYKAGDVKGAIKTYTALIDYDKKNADARYLRGTLYLGQGDTKNALTDYEAVLKLEKNNGARYNQIGEKLQNAGLEKETGTILNQALELKGEKAVDYRNKGYSCYLLGQYDSARTYLDKAINMEDKEAVFYLAQVLDAKGDKEQADQLYESYIKDHSDDQNALDALWRARVQEGNYTQALKFLQIALEQKDVQNAQELRRNEIAILEQLLDLTQAKEKMKAYVEDYPEDEAAAREYEFLKSR